MYTYRSPVGVFVIRAHAGTTGRWELIATKPDGTEVLHKLYQSMRAAAADVSWHRTGWPEWDLRPPQLDDPKTLKDWEKGRGGAGPS